MVDRLFDLQSHVACKIRAADVAVFDEQLTNTTVGLFRLFLQQFLELRLREHAVSYQQVAEAVASIDDARVCDAALLEKDLAEARGVCNGKTPGLETERQQLTDVCQARFFE